MAIKVVVLDGERLPAGVEFPPLEAEEYGWEQSPDLHGDDVAERCRQADILVALDSPVDAHLMEKLAKIGLVICAGNACELLDEVAVVTRGVEILAFPDADLGDAPGAQDLCGRISAAIDRYIGTRQPEAGS